MLNLIYIIETYSQISIFMLSYLIIYNGGKKVKNLKKDIKLLTNDKISYYKIPHYAFTLAEVLITLGIIGVVAAMTMPTLINQYQEKVADARSKKLKSILANGYKLMMAKEEVLTLNELPIMSNLYNPSVLSSEHKKAFQIIDDTNSNFDASTLPTEYTTSDNSTFSFDWESLPYIFRISDGSVFGIEPIDKPENPPNYVIAIQNNLQIAVDINGPEGPNKAGQDFFGFALSDIGTAIDITSIYTGECSPANPNGCPNAESCQALRLFLKNEHGCPWAYLDSDGQCIIASSMWNYQSWGPHYCM